MTICGGGHWNRAGLSALQLGSAHGVLEEAPRAPRFGRGPSEGLAPTGGKLRGNLGEPGRGPPAHASCVTMARSEGEPVPSQFWRPSLKSPPKDRSKPLWLYAQTNPLFMGVGGVL